ncbi:MAG: hypothetical protein AB7S65_02125 [Sulfuricurvum sp.]
MLENSLWTQYIPDKTIREVLARIYECDAVEIGNDERELYASLKRHLTKKEFRMIMMNEAGMGNEAIGEEVGLEGEALTKAIYKAYRKIRQDKIRREVKVGRVDEVVCDDDED